MKILLKLVATFLFVFSGLCNSYAADPALKESGTFTLEVTEVAMLSGQSALATSKGVIRFQGKDYPFSIQALSMGNRIGASTLKATGVLYGMKDISQVESPFYVIGAGISPSKEEEVGTYKNSQGVVAVMTGTLNDPLWTPSTGAVVKLAK